MRRITSMTLAIPLLVALAGIALQAGCKPRKYHVVTRIDPAGDFEREILQPFDDSLPPEALSVPKTQPAATQPAKEHLRPAWAKRWRTCELEQAPEESVPDTYIRAAGKFPAADLIPRSYHLPAYPLTDRAAVNQIDHTCDDYLLFSIDHWSETITDTVRLYEYVETVDEMTRQVLSPLVEMLQTQFGETYDLSGLYAWLGSKGSAIYRRWCLWYFENAPLEDISQLTPAAVVSLREAMAPFGFTLPCDETGERIDTDRVEPAIKDFAVRLLTGCVRLRSTGEPLTPEQANTLFELLGYGTTTAPADSQPAPASSDDTDTQPAEIHWEKAQVVFKEAFRRMNGVDWDETVALWSAKSGGAHLNGTLPGVMPLAPLVSTREYHFVLQAAGPVLETSGERTGPCEVTWDFTVYDIWPYGYQMHASAVRWNREAETRVFGRPVIENIDTVLTLADILDNHEAVAEALARAIETGSTYPLENVAATGSADERRAATSILDLGKPDTKPEGESR